MLLSLIVIPLLVVVLSTVFFSLYRNPNSLIVFGPTYIIRRDNGVKTEAHIAFGFIRGIVHPWYTGKGLQVRVGAQVIQVGLCKKNPQHKDDDGVLAAMGGRYMDVTAQDIREW